MRILRGTAFWLLCGAAAWGQIKISPRMPAGGAAAYIVEFRAGADMGRARDWLRENGFDLIEHPDLLPGHLLAAGPRGRLSEVAAGADVAYILPASTELAARERVVGCAGAITETGAAADYSETGRRWPKTGSGPVALRYFIQSLTGKLEASAARSEIERALGAWQKAGNLSFSEAESADAPRTIAIQFAHGPHGDGLPFDGPGHTLAHTYYPAPPNSEPIAGNMHLDADEDWNIGRSIDLYSVALHEAGHALGLGHSDQPGAVMYPYYRLSYGLTADDITGIQDLYGAPGTSQGSPATPPPPAPPATGTTPANPPAPPAPPSNPPVTPTGGDRTPPALRVLSPGTSIVATEAASLVVSGTASDDTGVVSVRWTTSTGESGVASGTASWSAHIPLFVGANVVTIRAYDAAGNSSWRALTVTRR